MDCETVRPKLAESITGAASGDLLAEHLEGCASCGEHLQELKALEKNLHTLPPVLPRFSDLALARPFEPAARRSKAGLLAAGLAAVLALSATGLFVIRGLHHPASPDPALAARVDQLLGALAVAEGDRRDDLKLELLNLGPIALPLLQADLARAPEGLRADLEELLLALQAAVETTVTVTSKDGETLRGTLVTTAFKMKTGFGETTVQIAKITSIDFGSPDVVTTRDKTLIKGKILLEEFKLKSDAGDVALKTANLKSIAVDGALGKLEKGKIEDGTAKNGMTYHLRVPAKYDPKKGMGAILILHGSNMNSKAYVETIVTAWPKLAEDYVLVGIDGEHRAKGSTDANPAYNYTYVNYAGKSKYKGYPGTERESPALVPEVLAEIRQRVTLTKIFVGGHSQGGFLTYSLLMNTPELFAGAFPVSAGVIIQCEPSAYDKPEVRAAQRKVPVAIVHGENDEAVGFSQGKSTYESFLDDGFPMLRFFTHKTAAHMFGLLPVDEAVRWLETMSSEDPVLLMDAAQKHLVSREFRDAVALADRARAFDKGGKLAAKLKSVDQAVEKEGAARAKALEKAIAETKDDSWVADFVAFRAQFEFAPCAKRAMDGYGKLRAEHEKPADPLFWAARGDFQNGKEDEGRRKAGEIVAKYYASSFYRYAKGWLSKPK